ncbi:hypothetical protein B296_00003940, partial [Ensete ventricosum]
MALNHASIGVFRTKQGKERQRRQQRKTRTRENGKSSPRRHARPREGSCAHSKTTVGGIGVAVPRALRAQMTNNKEE